MTAHSRRNHRLSFRRSFFEPLEDRLAMAFDLSISDVNNNITVGANPGGGILITPTGTGASVSFNEICNALAADNVFVSTGSAGAEAGNISADINVAAFSVPAGRTLTFLSGSGGAEFVGNIEIPGFLVSGLDMSQCEFCRGSEIASQGEFGWQDATSHRHARE